MAGFGGASMAVRVGGSGDVTKTHRLWYHARNPQRIGSPVLLDGRVYVLSDNGTADCLDLKTGEDVWKEDRVAGSTWGSMVAAGGRLYVTDSDGDTLVFTAGPKYELLAKNSLGETVRASIAISDGELFIRTYQHLWCIGTKK
jgi:outer membrane protein assembly factor BamB